MLFQFRKKDIKKTFKMQELPSREFVTSYFNYRTRAILIRSRSLIQAIHKYIIL